MDPPQPLLALTTVALFLLAGCTSGQSSDVAPPSSEAPIGTVSAEGGTESSGSIRGVVTNDELLPIANATVGIVEANLEVTTTEAGAFEFLQVPFGKYTVVFQALGYESKSLGAKTDELNVTADLKVTLVALVIVESYHTTFTWSGKMTCGLALVPWCGIFDELNQDYGTPNPTNERWLFNWTYPGGAPPSTVIFELVWTPSISGTAKEFVLLGLSGFGNQASGPSVLRMELDGALFADDLKREKDFRFRIGVYPELVDPVIDQRYSLHRTDFFGDPAPEGYSFLNETKP